MSKGISIYYKLISQDLDKLIYGYSGANINKEYDKKYLLSFDGRIEISISALKNKSASDSFGDGDIKVLQDCKYECHEPRLTNGDETIGFFAFKVASKIFREFKDELKISQKGGIVY